MKPAALILVLLAVGHASPAGAQVFAPPDAESPAPGPWHSALDALGALRDADAGTDAVLRAVEAELLIGRPERARQLLERHRVTDARLLAMVSFDAGDYARAGALFADAAGGVADSTARGLLSARAGDAFERAGLPGAAVASYRAAREVLPAVAGWLALREARVSADTAAAFALLESAPPAGRFLVTAARAELIAAAGDTTRAVAVLAGAGIDGRAALLALASGDSGNARQLTYRAIRAGDSAVSAVGIDLAQRVFAPAQPVEFLALARAVRRRAPATAAELVDQAVARGDGGAATLVLLGEIRAEAGDQQGALEAYRRAAGSGAPESAGAEFSVARTLIRLGRPVAAARAIDSFLVAHPRHAFAPMATFLLGDLTQDAGRREAADSLYRAVVQTWPSHDYASQARFRLATNALVRRDTSRALAWYRAEVEARGPQQASARYLFASLASRGGDTAVARVAWRDLARSDSLGYFGGVARERVGLALPLVAPPAPASPSRSLTRAMNELDLLDQAGFGPEAAAQVVWLLAQDLNADEALDLAEALSARGRPTVAINLGWRAARTLSLNHPRVLRAIYPWPLRDVVSAEAREFELDQYLLAALIRQESSFDPLALSRAGARGLMQVMPATARQAASRAGVEWSDQLLRVPDANIHVGAAHLATLLRHYRGEVSAALAAYNAGLTPVERWRQRFPEARDPVQFTERIPYAETRGYVRTVMRNWALYRILYAADPAGSAAGGP